MTNLTFYLSLLLGLGLVTACLANECYVCENQESNHDKCIKTTRQCLQSEGKKKAYV